MVVLTKRDLVEDPDEATNVIEDSAPGSRIHFTNGLTGEGVEALGAYTAGNRTIVLIGASGVGKSTLANRLLGESTGEDAFFVGARAFQAMDGDDAALKLLLRGLAINPYGTKLPLAAARLAFSTCRLASV